MRIPSLCVTLPFLLACVVAPAQQTSSPGAPAAPAGSDWQHVQVLPVGTAIHIQARSSHALCALTAVDADSISCLRDTGVGNKPLTFQRSDVRTIKLARRGHSAVLGGAVAGGAGALAGAIQATQSHYFAVKGAFPMIYGFIGIFAGAPLGYISDFSASTIYRAP